MASQAEGPLAAGRCLQELLTSRQQYRRHWQQHVRRMRSDEISYAGISQVLALYLWDVGLRSEQDKTLPRKLRTRVARALQGEQLTQETLTWMQEAFYMSDEDRHELWSLFSGGTMPERETVGVSYTLRAPRPMIYPQRHRTVALFSRYYIDANRMLWRNEIDHIIVATQDNVDRYLFATQPTLKEVTVISGGRVGSMHQYGEDLKALDLMLDEPLNCNQTTSLSYVATFHPGEKSSTEVRRAARARTDNVDIRVTFNSATLPHRMWWSIWDAHTNGESVSEEEVAFEGKFTLHRFIPFVEQAVIGFRWEW